MNYILHLFYITNTTKLFKLKSDSIWRGNMLGYLSADIICLEKRTAFRERNSWKTARTNIRAYFRAKWRLLCLLSLKYILQLRGFENWAISLRYFPVTSMQSRDTLRPIACERNYLMFPSCWLEDLIT